MNSEKSPSSLGDTPHFYKWREVYHEQKEDLILKLFVRRRHKYKPSYKYESLTSISSGRDVYNTALVIKKQVALLHI
jgi:hypothetical protein